MMSIYDAFSEGMQCTIVGEMYRTGIMALILLEIYINCQLFIMKNMHWLFIVCYLFFNRGGIFEGPS